MPNHSEPEPDPQETPGPPRCTPRERIVWAVLLGLALLLAGHIWVTHLPLSVRLALAREQVMIFDEMVTKAQEAPPEEACGYLEYIVFYYPSGTKQVEGSKLDTIVELSRKNAIRAVINDLRRRTGQDFGDDPRVWIQNLRPEGPHRGGP